LGSQLEQRPLPGKKIYVQKKELLYAICPMEIITQFMSPSVRALACWIRAINQLEVVDGEVELDDGITLIPLPGHTEGYREYWSIPPTASTCSQVTASILTSTGRATQIP
jgi:hypothetical protein